MSERNGITPWKVLVPLFILGATFGLYFRILLLEKTPEKEQPVIRVPTVEFLVAEQTNAQLEVLSQGTVQARTASDLAAEISGRIVEVSPYFRPGGFFREGDVLVRIEQADYEAQLAEARSRLAQAQVALLQEEAAAAQARRDWQSMGEGTASALTLREPQVAQAKAVCASAEAAVARAERDLERTEIRAPYDGRVVTQIAEIGQWVGPGSPLAHVYATDIAEVRLPLSLDEAAMIDLPVAYAGEPLPEGPPVTLSAEIGGQTHQWQGHIVRTEATIDAQTRLTYAVAQVEAPYARDPAHPQRPPLKVGQFVEARIAGRALEQVFKVPLFAVHGERTLWVVPSDQKLYQREVRIVARDRDSVYIREGLEPGEAIVTSPLEFVTAAMPVILASTEAPTDHSEAAASATVEAAQDD